ncbi:uncharacterized protein TRIADDRAFT_52514 [Trichoplax adhaerens]|uniref:alpha-1,2-Mannosidase n=1 Tax=Trichoplax adhaerens TaxID=10228 RepID=B3RIZ7_TRIAD|nr:hypothetical protein TRIADDRAFT_52514 [Trichoplax adhaerens]EDV29034.1 hypothetical protein TRIADDRAFT_52514 [Trichoplax adhaerens]|eukprot:XP_002108236.1 hypothetical protein TRIADDRAFT_52514 [Trichoplax adhaerens]
MVTNINKFSSIIIVVCLTTNFARNVEKWEIDSFRRDVKEMFYHGYDNYLRHAYPYDELKPLSCQGMNTWGSFSLTLIDSLDTLLIMGNKTEFARVVKILIDTANFDIDINVSVFETNIRIVGGLLSAHLLSHKAGLELEDNWPCDGPLLRLAVDVADRLLPAFDTRTNLPYGTINLRHGVPKGETTITSTATCGTLIVEFGTLSLLTGVSKYKDAAMKSILALWEKKSAIGLVGNHIDSNSGSWTAKESGIGGGIDSYFEYLVKGSLLNDDPELMDMFKEYNKAIYKYLNYADWYVWADMMRGNVVIPIFQSLDAFWPGIQVLVGNITQAAKTFRNYYSVWRRLGFIPESYAITDNMPYSNRNEYPLRPELIESAWYLYIATKDPIYLEAGMEITKSINRTRTKCGFATVKNVMNHELEDRMESFFLAETTKYLYLLFDTENFINNDGKFGVTYKSKNGKSCILDSGSYIFNTEAHPIDKGAFDCCHSLDSKKFSKLSALKCEANTFRSRLSTASAII